MFFTQDILYKQGPLALIWWAGNATDELRSREKRGRRSKQYQLIISSDVAQLCDIVRSHFPEMGSAKGMSLKKVATLVKGLGFVYFSKIDDLTKNLSEFHLKLQVTARLREIDLPTNVGGKAANLVSRGEIDNEVIGFGELNEDIDFSTLIAEDDDDVNYRAVHAYGVDVDYPGLIATPRREVADETEDPGRQRGKKRRRGRKGDPEEASITEETVLQMLRKTVDQDPRAHCLNESPDLGALGGDMGMGLFNFDGFFGEDDNILRDMQAITGDSDVLQPNGIPLERISPEDGLGSPLGRRNVTPGENALRQPGQYNEEGEMQLPNHVENEEIQLQIQPDQDSRNLQLETLVEDDRVLILRRGKRRSKRLIVDENTTISAAEINDQIRQHMGPLDYDELRLSLARRYAPSKKEALRLEGLACMDVMGRKHIGGRLSEMIGTLHPEPKKQKRRAPVEELARAPAQQQSVSNIDQSTNDQGNVLRQDRTNEGHPDGSSAAAVHGQSNELPPAPDISEAGGETFGPGVHPDNDFNVDPENEMERDQVEQNIGDILESDESPDRKTFRMMFPPQNSSRRQAALGFFQLLRLKGKEMVDLEQDAPYGEIIVRQTATIERRTNRKE